MPNNSNTLTQARINKKDEFYTQLKDICYELCMYDGDKYVLNDKYKDCFNNSTVLCNCNDTQSDFGEFFRRMFNVFCLDKLITVSYGKNAYKSEKTPNNIIETKLSGDGDFRSEEGVYLIEQADIVCTNPPFSLSTDFLKLLVEKNKKFLVIGDITAVEQSSIFSLFKSNQLWFGTSIQSGDRVFGVPLNYLLNASGCGTKEENKKFIRVKGIRWYTNLGTPPHKPFIPLSKSYYENLNDYPRYSNLDAIEVKYIKNIPADYFGLIGVPITFFDKFNPEQFEVIGMDRDLTTDGGRAKIIKDGVEETLYARVIVKRKGSELS